MIVPFPFTNLSSVKLRPALIISDEHLTSQDIVVIFISSHVSGHLYRTDLKINRSDAVFSQTGLKTSSIFRCNKIATLEKQIVFGEIGMLPMDWMKKIDAKLKLVLGLK